MLNGVLVGVVSDLVPNPTMLAAALLPHGIIELPSFVLAGSAGIKLGVAFLRSLRGSNPERIDAFHTIARQTFYLIIGLALLFFIAGFIEGNITPVIMRMAGWD
jgi:stage II sporulation protein M